MGTKSALKQRLHHSLYSPSRDCRCLHRRAPVLQQLGGRSELRHAAAHEHLPLQEGDGDLQLQLSQQHPGCQAQQTCELPRLSPTTLTFNPVPHNSSELQSELLSRGLHMLLNSFFLYLIWKNCERYSLNLKQSLVELKWTLIY